jgi:WD40 repeat protein
VPVQGILQWVRLVPKPSTGDVYHAFISYSHEADAQLAVALQSGLQRFAKPWYRPRALRIFRDESSLSNDPGLWSAIARGIDSSEHLIVLASEDAAKSDWCAKEVEYWRARKGNANVLIVLTHGKIKWDKTRNDFDWADTTALAPTMRGICAEEPRITDMVWAHKETDLSLSHAQFRDAIADLAAPLHGKRKDEIAGDEVREHRRTMRIVRNAVLLLLGLTALAVGAAVLALLARNDAIRQRRNAVSRVLASQSGRELRASLPSGALTAVAAYREKATPEAMASLVNAVQQTASVERVLRASGTGTASASWSEDPRRLATADVQGVRLWDPRTGAFVRLPGSSRVDEVALNRDGSLVATRDRGTVLVRHVTAPGRSWQVVRAGATSIDFAGRFDTLAIGMANGRVVLWRPEAFVARVLLHRGSGVVSVAFAPNGRKLVAAAGSYGLVVLRLDDVGRVSGVTRLKPTTALDDVAIGGGGLLVGLDVFNRALIRETGDWRLLAKDVTAIAASSTGTVATGDPKGTIRFWRPRESAAAVGEHSFDDTRIAHLTFDADGRTLAATSIRGAVVLWQARGDSLEHTLPELDAERGAAFVSDGDVAAAGEAAVALGDVQGGPSHELPQLPGSYLEILGLAVPDHPVGDRPGDVVAVRAADSVILWKNVHAKPQPFRLRHANAGPTAIAFSRDGTLLAQGTDRGTVDVWSVGSPAATPVSVPTGPRPVVAVSFDPTGRTIAAGRTDGKVVVIDWRAGKVVATPQEQGNEVDALAFSPSGALLAFGGWSRSVTLWGVQAGAARAATPRTTGARVTALAFAPDSRALAWSDTTGNVVLWDVAHDTLIGEVPPAGPSGDSVVSLQFSKDGSQLLAARDGTAVLFDDRLWNAQRAIGRLCTLFAASSAAADPGLRAGRRNCRPS